MNSKPMPRLHLAWRRSYDPELAAGWRATAGFRRATAPVPLAFVPETWSSARSWRPDRAARRNSPRHLTRASGPFELVQERRPPVTSRRAARSTRFEVGGGMETSCKLLLHAGFSPKPAQNFSGRGRRFHRVFHVERYELAK